MSAMSFHVDESEDTALQAALLRQPRHVLFPPADQFSTGFGESGWRAAMRASNEHLIPRGLTLGFQAGRGGRDVPPQAYLDTLLLALRLQADVLAEDREVVAMVLQLGLAETLPPPQLGQLLDAVPQHLRTVARPQVEVRLDAGSALAPAQLRAVGCTRLNVIDRADAPGPTLLAQARQVGFTARYYQLRVPGSEDAGFIERLHEVLAEAPERILLPAPCALPEYPRPSIGCRPGACCALRVTNRLVAITISAAICRTRTVRAMASAIAILPACHAATAVISSGLACLPAARSARCSTGWRTNWANGVRGCRRVTWESPPG